MKHVLLALAGFILLSAARAAVPVEWTADIDNPAARPIAVGLGETVRLVARLQRHGAPYDPGIATAALYLQTNGMDRTWLTAPATVASNELSALYPPAMMGGAPVVSAFLGGRAGDGGVYRAFAILRTYHAPGALPGVMPPEAPADLDFSAFTYTNAPWATPEAVDAAIASIPPPDLSAYQRHDSAALGADSFAASDGGAWGDRATATATGAYQIGEGVNSAANTLQFRGHRLLDAAGTIPDERLPDVVRRGARFADASWVLWRDLAERVEVLEDAQ